MTVVALAILLLMVFAQAAPAFEAPGDIGIYDSDVTIQEGDGLSIWCYWVAGSPGTVRSYLHACRDTVEITTSAGSSVFYAGPDETVEWWGPIEIGGWDSALWFPRKANSKTPVATCTWVMELPTAGLPAGEYVIHYESDYGHNVVDLGDWDGDGKLDHIHPGEAYITDILLTIE